MRRLATISEIEEKYRTAGSQPIRVLADDLEHYICKYPFHDGDPKLLNEYLGARFAEHWNIEVPEVVLMDVAREHVKVSVVE